MTAAARAGRFCAHFTCHTSAKRTRKESVQWHVRVEGSNAGGCDLRCLKQMRKCAEAKQTLGKAAEGKGAECAQRGLHLPWFGGLGRAASQKYFGMAFGSEHVVHSESITCHKGRDLGERGQSLNSLTPLHGRGTARRQRNYSLFTLARPGPEPAPRPHRISGIPLRGNLSQPRFPTPPLSGPRGCAGIYELGSRPVLV